MGRVSAGSFVKLETVFTHPFDEILDENVLVKAVYQKSHIGVTM